MMEYLSKIISSLAHIFGILAVLYLLSRNKKIPCLLNVFICAFFLTMFIVKNNKIVMFFICVFELLFIVYSINKDASKNVQNNENPAKQKKRNST
jgi:hypothetical protein